MPFLLNESEDVIVQVKTRERNDRRKEYDFIKAAEWRLVYREKLFHFLKLVRLHLQRSGIAAR